MIGKAVGCCYCGRDFIYNGKQRCPYCSFPFTLKAAQIWCKLRTVGAGIAIAGFPASFIYLGTYYLFGWPSIPSAEALFMRLFFFGLLLAALASWQSHSYTQV